MVSTLIIGIIILVAGLLLRYWINRRKFYRRSITGSEGFSSYERSVAVRFAEWLGKLIAYVLIILGLLSIWSYYREKRVKEKKQDQMMEMKK